MVCETGADSSCRHSFSNSVSEQTPTQSRSRFGLGQINPAEFLFDDTADKSHGKKTQTTSPDVKSYLQMMDTNDKFPILTQTGKVRHVCSGRNPSTNSCSQSVNSGAHTPMPPATLPAPHTRPSLTFSLLFYSSCPSCLCFPSFTPPSHWPSFLSSRHTFNCLFVSS